MFKKTYSEIRALLVRLATFLIGFGFILAISVGVLSFTELQWFWIRAQLLIKLSMATIVAGITIVLNFATWVEFERSTLRTKALGLVFNYGAILVVFGGGVTYLLEVFWLHNTSLALVALRYYVFGVFFLIIRNKLIQLLARLLHIEH